MKSKLFIFLKWPEPGKVKTRLAEKLTAFEAAQIYRRLAEETLERLKAISEKAVEITVFFDPPEARARIEAWLKGPFRYLPQAEGDLGARLQDAARSAFKEGAKRLVMIGTDCPTLAISDLEAAFQSLKENDVVLGPTEDGGYYLIGLRREADGLFQSIPWSTPEVLSKTVEAARRGKLSLARLPVKRDIDTYEDYRVLTGGRP